MTWQQVEEEWEQLETLALAWAYAQACLNYHHSLESAVQIVLSSRAELDDLVSEDDRGIASPSLLDRLRLAVKHEEHGERMHHAADWVIEAGLALERSNDERRKNTEAD